MKNILTLCITLLLSASLYAADVAWKTKPTMTKKGNTWEINFSISTATDVEVAILDSKGKVVRHLAAGVLGPKAPAPLKKDSLSQKLIWDGNDDYETKVAGECTLRVRAGMGVKLVNIVGGDPYAFYSKDMGQGDHAAWKIMGLEVKSDGTVYITGNINHYGPAVVRRYDAEGKYLQTVYPAPAGKKFEQIKGWGAHQREDGSSVFKYHNIDSISLSNTGITGDRAFFGSLLPSGGKDSLYFIGKKFNLIKVNTDGTIPENPNSEGFLVNDPIIGDKAKRPTWHVLGTPFTAPSADGKYFYLSGVFKDGKRKRSWTRAKNIETTGFWRDGQIYKVDSKTRKAEVFFALDKKSVIGDMKSRGTSPIADDKTAPFAALQGIAIDAKNNVFICDRQNKRILILDKDAKKIREIPAEYPDAIAVDPNSKALYYTTRKGNYHKKSPLYLYKIRDWTKDKGASVSKLLDTSVGTYRSRSYLGVTTFKGKARVWVAYVTLPVRIYEDTGNKLELVKDFYKVGTQRILDMQHMIVDPKNEDVYLSESWGYLFRLDNWSKPEFKKCEMDITSRRGKKNSNSALGFAIDPRKNLFYMRGDRTPLYRMKWEGGKFVPAPAGSHIVTTQYYNDWRIHLGHGERGLAVAPDGGIGILASHKRNDYSGPLAFYASDTKKAPWKEVPFVKFGTKPISAGIKFDAKGNMYVGLWSSKTKPLPGTMGKDSQLLRSFGKIYKYKPTGSLLKGNLYPTEPEGSSKVYEVHFGSISRGMARTAFFGVDPYGQIYYPSSLLSRVTVMDNEGNQIIRFGTWGNRDSMGGLKGDLVPTKDIPMAYPSSVDVTDDYIYVSDLVNARVLRLKKTFKLTSN
ncbi:MAG: hypothetical protein COA79_11900 [Planctomycetota bacterium]|nr:MAG: hypothetical protein COA79_11900 [Planctomycetota bacterium]